MKNLWTCMKMYCFTDTKILLKIQKSKSWWFLFKKTHFFIRGEYNVTSLIFSPTLGAMKNHPCTSASWHQAWGRGGDLLLITFLRKVLEETLTLIFADDISWLVMFHNAWWYVRTLDAARQWVVMCADDELSLLYVEYMEWYDVIPIGIWDMQA